MFFKSSILTIIIAVLSSSLTGQIRLDLKEGCNYTHGVNNMSDFYGYAPSEDAQQIVKKILDIVNISHKRFQVIAGNVNSAMATKEGEVNYIIYNELFINKFRQDVNQEYAIYSILAHELGHLIQGHDLGEKDPDRRARYELEADEFSGTILRSLCSTQEQALFAIRNLNSTIKDPLYPPLSAREQMIATSWRQRNQDILKGKLVDPCGETIVLKFGDKLKSSGNLINNARGRIMGDVMVITYDMDNLPGENRYKTMMATPRLDDLSPRSIEWQSDPNQPGKEKRAIWHFARDGYSKAQANQSARLGLASFKENRVPKARAVWEYTPGAALLALGGLSFSRAGKLKRESVELYDNTYAEFRNETADIYQGSNPSRDEVYAAANDIHRQAQTARFFGALGTAVGAAYLFDRYLKDKRGRIANLHFGENGIGGRLTIGN
ncbi:M48 family metalloprotease [Neolewinella persica]|uniref:hypothetical protein n=1 Tax=Neolewinella persica TaxID=70998 RepID=UPI00037531ED|nr:hypothetical protein [Neolewinella persica]